MDSNKTDEEVMSHDTSQTNEKDNIRDSSQEDRKKHTRVKIAVAICIVIIIILLLLTQCGRRNGIQQGIIDLPTNNSGYTQRMVDEAVARGMFQVFINTSIQVSNEGTANVLIQNSGNNHYPCFVEIKYEDKVVYKSDIIKPGYKLETASGVARLPRGDYACTAYFNILDHRGSVVNKIGVDVKLTYESEDE